GMCARLTGTCNHAEQHETSCCGAADGKGCVCEVCVLKPHVICHMGASVDGRTLSSRWRPKGATAGGLFERLHEELSGDAWLVGRVTGQEFAKGKAYPAHTNETFPREAWFARRDAKAYGVVLDAHGKIAWSRADIGGDPIVVVLTERVADAHLA